MFKIAFGETGIDFARRLAPVETGQRKTENQKENDESYGALHKYCRMVSP